MGARARRRRVEGISSHPSAWTPHVPGSGRAFPMGLFVLGACAGRHATVGEMAVPAHGNRRAQTASRWTGHGTIMHAPQHGTATEVARPVQRHEGDAVPEGDAGNACRFVGTSGARPRRKSTMLWTVLYNVDV